MHHTVASRTTAEAGLVDVLADCELNSFSLVLRHAAADGLPGIAESSPLACWARNATAQSRPKNQTLTCVGACQLSTTEVTTSR